MQLYSSSSLAFDWSVKWGKSWMNEWIEGWKTNEKRKKNQTERGQEGKVSRMCPPCECQMHLGVKVKVRKLQWECMRVAEENLQVKLDLRDKEREREREREREMTQSEESTRKGKWQWHPCYLSAWTEFQPLHSWKNWLLRCGFSHTQRQNRNRSRLRPNRPVVVTSKGKIK